MQCGQALELPDYYLFPVPITIIFIFLSNIQSGQVMKGYVIGILLGVLTILGAFSIFSPLLGITEHVANLINCVIGGAGLLGLCYTLYLQMKATELQANATLDQITANANQNKAQFRQEMLNTFSTIADKKSKIKIIPIVECKLPPPELTTDVSTQFNIHCAALTIIMSRYPSCSNNPSWKRIFDLYMKQFYCLVDNFFPYAIAFKNAAEKITRNEVLSDNEKEELLQSLHETLSPNDASALGLIYMFPHFKKSDWINKHFTHERCVCSICNSIHNVCENEQFKATLQTLIGEIGSDNSLHKAAEAFVNGLKEATMQETTYWSMYVATGGYKG